VLQKEAANGKMPQAFFAANFRLQVGASKKSRSLTQQSETIRARDRLQIIRNASGSIMVLDAVSFHNRLDRLWS
jgi:hypothetical protein